MKTASVGAMASTMQRRGQQLAKEGNTRQLPVLKIMVLASFNVDSLTPFLLAALEARGFWGDIHIGPFGQFAQVILDNNAEMYRFAPDIVVMLPAAEDVLVSLFQRSGGFTADQSNDLVAGRLEEIQGWLGVLLERLPVANVFAVPFGTDRLPGAHILQSRSPVRGRAAAEAFVQGVRALEEISPRVVTVDWDWHARSIGWASLRDDRLWHLARMRLSFAGLAELGELLAQHAAVVRRPAKKVAVLDLDNTLWGGVVGEAGVEGIELGNEGVGMAFQDFQRELLKWHDAGILLAICSKNNQEDALQAIDQHPAGVLKREHFAAMRINWQDKATNIRELATELNLGIDSFVFFDDNPVERGWVSSALPEVLVPELPADPVERPAFLRAAEYFWRVQVTDTDLARAQSYQAAKVREEWKASIADFNVYLAELKVELDIAPLDKGSLARAAQMCERTNQFNLTTRRYTAAELAEFMTDERVAVYTLNVRDRFEDSGLTGLAILRHEGDHTDVDTLLLSCRVLGRKVEDAFLAFLVSHAKARGSSQLRGRFLPTKKNAQVARFYPDRGFSVVDDTTFALRLTGEDAMPEIPQQLTLNVR